MSTLQQYIKQGTNAPDLYVLTGVQLGEVERLNSVVTKTSGYTPTATDGGIICNCATTMQITLPTASGTGIKYSIKNIASDTVTITNSTDMIDGSSTQSLYQFEGVQLIDYGTNVWVVV